MVSVGARFAAKRVINWSQNGEAIRRFMSVALRKYIAENAGFSFETRGSEGWLSLTGDHPYGFQAGDLKLASNIPFAAPEEAAVSGGFMGAAINVAEVYAHLVRDLHAGTYSTPGFQHAVHNARLIATVRHAAEQGAREKILEQIEDFDEARATSVG